MAIEEPLLIKEGAEVYEADDVPMLNDDDDLILGDSDDDSISESSEEEPLIAIKSMASLPWYHKDKRAKWYSLCSRQHHVHKFVIPFSIILNVILFLWSNSSVGASVHANITLPKMFGVQPPVQSIDTFDFSLFNSVESMYKSQSYALAFLIAGLSGVWPYVKSLSLFLCWYCPMPTKLRGRILWVLDACGKWSLIDMYVLCFMMVAFKFNLNVLGVDIGINVWPMFGIYSFCAAAMWNLTLTAMWNLTLSHFMTYLHHLAIKTSEIRADDAACTQEDDKPHRLDTPYVQKLVSYLLLVAFALTLSSLLLVSFEFEFEGLVGEMLDSNKTSSEYSLVSAGAAIPGSSSTIVGPVVLTMIYFLFVFSVPLIHIVMLCILWEVKSLSVKTERILFNSCEIIYAWAALDVGFVAIIAAMLEIGKLSHSIVADTCNQVNILIGTECFKVEAFIRNGIFIMAPALILTMALNTFVMLIVDGRITRRERRERRMSQTPRPYHH
eukprot:Awhi_evm1s12603